MGIGGARTRARALGLGLPIALASALVLAACGDGSSSETTTSPTTPAAHESPSATQETTLPSDPPSTALDPAHVVDRPGAFQAPLHTSDMLVFRQHPLSDAMVHRIRQVKGVTQVEQFSLAQVSIQDHAINVAAVDPATYRNFNPDAAAQFQPEWNRVAGGEIALRTSLRKQVAKSGFVALGAGSDAPEVHVGA
jgi:hypothetical protein